MLILMQNYLVYNLYVGVCCEEVAVEDVSSDNSWNGVSCWAQVRPSRSGC